jgi:hypothetical protein
MLPSRLSDFRGLGQSWGIAKNRVILLRTSYPDKSLRIESFLILGQIEKTRQP